MCSQSPVRGGNQPVLDPAPNSAAGRSLALAPAPGGRRCREVHANGPSCFSRTEGSCPLGTARERIQGAMADNQNLVDAMTLAEEIVDNAVRAHQIGPRSSAWPTSWRAGPGSWRPAPDRLSGRATDTRPEGSGCSGSRVVSRAALRASAFLYRGRRSVVDPVSAVDVRTRLRLVEAGLDAEPADRAPQ